MPSKGNKNAQEKLVVKGLYKIFGPDPDRAYKLLESGKTKDEIQAETGMVVGVKDANFAVREGEVFVVMGLSGSGKSTLVRMLNRLIEPTYGEVRIDGRHIGAMNIRELTELRRSDLSMVFQSFALMPHLSVLENAAYGLTVARVPRAEREARALAALESVGLKANAHSYPDALSGGMKQRVGLARALAVDPAIMLMDEAFSALDPLIRTEMQDELLRLQAAHARTVVFISHDLDEAIRIGDRIAIMQGGEIVQIGTPDEILQNPANDYVASFFRGVDVSQVLTAGDIAADRAVSVVDRPGSGLRTVDQLMSDQNRDFAVILGPEHDYLGMVTVDTVRAAMKRGRTAGWAEARAEGVRAIRADAQLRDVMDAVADSPVPLPVVDDHGRYRGIISQAMLLRALSRSEEGAERTAAEEAAAQRESVA